MNNVPSSSQSYNENIKFYRFLQKKAEKLGTVLKSFTACLKAPFRYDDVILARNKLKQSAIVKGLIRCKSKVCPICSAIIFRENHTNIQKAVKKQMEDKTKSVGLMTLTIPHQKTDNLSDLIKKFDNAKQDFWRSAVVKRFRKVSGLIGRITSLEVNYSDKNGYHPHFHILLFCDKIEFNKVESELKEQWVSSTSKQGLKVSLNIGLTMQDGREIQNYITKLSNEITGSQIKETRNGGLTMWGLARSAYHTGNEKHLELFFNICSVLRGKRLITWSRGLKKHFGITDLTEDEIIKQEESRHEDIFLIGYHDYLRVIESGHDLAIMELLATDRLSDLEFLLDNLGILYIDLRKRKIKKNMFSNNNIMNSFIDKEFLVI